uniref:Sushi domain-containing protein n=1 Tax=Parascaris univalens TaxID=6257 RepID=A0A915BEM7_PARUN
MRCGEGRRLKLNNSLVHPLRAAYLRCTLSALTLKGEWALIGMLDYFASFTPTCTSEAATFVICDLPHLNPDEFLIERSKKARFYKHNETLTLRCARSDSRLLPNGNHTLRCDDTGWVHEVNKHPVADVSPVCVAHSRCTLQQIPKYLHYAINGSICNESSEHCPSNNETLSVGFKVTLSCKSQSLRLNGHSEIICAESQVVDGSIWHPIKWPHCSSKLNCLTPYIHLGDYLAEDSSNIFRPGSRVSFECFEEHKLIGNRVVECTDVGYWNDTLPTCIEDVKEINESLVYSALIVTKVILLFILAFMIKLIRDQNRKFRRESYNRPLKAKSPPISPIPPSDVRILNLSV